MKNNHLSNDLRELLNAKEDLCVSLVIPMNELPSMKKLDKIVIDHSIDKLKTLLDKNYDASLVSQFTDKLRSAGE